MKKQVLPRVSEQAVLDVIAETLAAVESDDAYLSKRVKIMHEQNPQILPVLADLGHEGLDKRTILLTATAVYRLLERQAEIDAENASNTVDEPAVDKGHGPFISVKGKNSSVDPKEMA
jgi:hypothetical protein